MWKLVQSVLIAMVVMLPGACATTVGTLAGPVTGPITFWNNTYGMSVAKPFLLPFTIPFGPLLGLVQGARVDLGYVAHGEYGVDENPPFELIWDPAKTQR